MRTAVFVDAGYLYAQGSSVVTGLKKPKGRETLTLDYEKLVDLLKRLSQSKSGGRELLRIYWYDGAPASGPSAVQTRVGQMDDVKLRLGQLNAEGQQKGVDSLIVTDLMELARNKAILDAIVLTGDEDIRVGVQIAQSLGVRVHLLGIGGAKASQSFSLLQEADTITLWGKPDVATFLKLANHSNNVAVQAPAAKRIAQAAPPPAKAKTSTPAKTAVVATTAKISADQIAKAVAQVIELLRADDKRWAAAKKLADAGKQLPGPLVANLKTALVSIYGKPLTKAEHKLARDAMAQRLKELA